MSKKIIPFTTTNTAKNEGIYYEPWPTSEMLAKAHADDAAYDLRAAEDCCLAPGDTKLIKTGIFLVIPEGFAGLILPRSGLALKHGITVLNAPGLIDPGYRGEVGVILHHTPDFEFLQTLVENNLRDTDVFQIKHGDRIAQLLIVRTTNVSFTHEDTESWGWMLRAEKARSERGEGGFGSTGR